LIFKFEITDYSTIEILLKVLNSNSLSALKIYNGRT
jgi:hypothetical protein